MGTFTIDPIDNKKRRSSLIGRMGSDSDPTPASADETAWGIINSRDDSQSAAISQVDLDTRAKIQTLEKSILSSRRHYNKISVLLGFARDQQAKCHEDILAAVALGRIFTQFFTLGVMSVPVGAPESELMVMKWLMQKYEDYKIELLRLTTSPYPDTSMTALTIIMQLIRDDSSQKQLTDETPWREGLFPQLLNLLVSAPNIGDVRAKFTDQYLKMYDDVRYYSFCLLENQLSSETSKTSIAVITSMMTAFDKVPESREDIGSFFISRSETSKDLLLSPNSHKKVAQKFWMAVIRLDLDASQRDTILESIPHKIAPWLLKVELLMDFLTDSFDAGGVTSLNALSGLFHLIKEKSLDYPQFYTKLYSLLTPSTMHSKRRSRFFRLLDTFLSSTHLPAALVASFIKRLSRLALYAPPSGIVAVVPWIYNLLRNHPICTFMLHRKLQLADDAAMSMKEKRWTDTFQMEEPDPMKTGALESSLWEIQMLQSHYHPNVATIARIISEQFTKPFFNLEHFLNHSYGSMLNAELTKNLKRPPEVEYEIPKKIFLQHSAESGQQDALITKLWDFS